MKELDFNGNICEISDKDFKYTNRHRKTKANEYDSQFKDYRDNDLDERTKHINKELNKLAIH